MKTQKLQISLIIAAVVLLTAYCHSLNKGTRVLGVDVTMAQDNNYNEAATRAQNAGAQVVDLAFDWIGLEIAPGNCSNQQLPIANYYYPLRKLRIDLAINPVDTVGPQLPADLANRNYDDPLVISRFEQCLASVFSQIPKVTINALVIGNEIDAGLKNNADQWSHYINFFQAIRSYLKTNYPSLVVGTTSTFYGLIGTSKTQMLQINQFTDAVMVTYYPLYNTYLVKDPSIIASEIATMIGIYPSKTIYMMEVGYPSSSYNNSSEVKQSQFVSTFFSVWDTYATHIAFVSFSILTDRSQAYADQAGQYYGNGSKAFTEYVRTIGLFSYPSTGTAKQAYGTLKQQAKSRGW